MTIFPYVHFWAEIGLVFANCLKIHLLPDFVEIYIAIGFSWPLFVPISTDILLNQLVVVDGASSKMHSTQQGSIKPIGCAAPAECHQFLWDQLCFVVEKRFDDPLIRIVPIGAIVEQLDHGFILLCRGFQDDQTCIDASLIGIRFFI